VLEDATNTSVEEELHSSLSDLNEDEQAEVFALMLVGRGSYDAADWDEAVEMATEEVSDIVAELMETPMLASLIEAGLAAFGLSCDGIGQVS
jgi:hypothetical protein